MKYNMSLITSASLSLAIMMSSCNLFSKNTVAQESKATTPIETEAPQPVSVTQTDNNFTPIGNDLECKTITKGTGAITGNPGDLGEMRIVFKIGDSTIINTDEMNNRMAVQQAFQAPSMKGDVMEGLMKMKAGDEMEFRILADTLFTRSKQTKPAWVKPGAYATWYVHMVNVKTKAEVESAAAKHQSEQKGIDEKLIQDYFKAKGIKNAKKTASGLYYVVSKVGTGAKPTTGKKVTVNYTGQNLKGEKFDSNVDPAFNHVEPFSFDLGKGGVIKGWDEAAALMNKGTKATFYMPSHLAYGERGAGAKIPPNAVLIFEIELLDFK
jgi:FKBP-type peptidyl-prolyl cis-trans isomerase FkpA